MIKKWWPWRAKPSRSLTHDLEAYLASQLTKLAIATEPEKNSLLQELGWLLDSENEAIQIYTARWSISHLCSKPELSEAMRNDLFFRISKTQHPALSDPIWKLVETMRPISADWLTWLVDMALTQPTLLPATVSRLCKLFYNEQLTERRLVRVLGQLDKPNGAVTDYLLQHFPAKTEAQNEWLIHMLGILQRPRALKPLIVFAKEFPEWLRQVLKALSFYDSADLEAFYIESLHSGQELMVLMEITRQIRSRKLYKAVPQLEALFPVYDPTQVILTRSLNGELAMTLAQFGCHEWAQKKLLPEMLLNGVEDKYLTAIDVLSLQEAVPYLKALILAPEVPEIQFLQEKAFRICERLLHCRASSD
jgi:hypothetical protein